jgi:choline dehydrogenase-like flavoprotein
VSERHDVAIVGGGTAGCVLAARLSEDPGCKVCLIEAGPDLRAAMPPEIRSGWRPTRSCDWGYVAEPDGYGNARQVPRGRLLGGCSSTNATFALRGSPGDYDAWAAAGNPGWSFDDLLPYFVRLESDVDFGDQPWHGDSGPIPIRRYGPAELTQVGAAGLEALEALGLDTVADHNAPGAVGAGPTPVNCLDGNRISTALAYLPAPGERDNLTIRCGAEAADVVMDGIRAAGVRLLSGGEVEADLVVLCGGAYASPALLLRSGVGPASELEALGIEVRVDLPGVGHNLADHPSVSLTLPYGNDAQPEPLFQVVATLHSPQTGAAGPPDLQLVVFGPYEPDGDGPSTFMCAAALLKPRSRGTVSLRSAAPSDSPRIDLGYLGEDVDADRLVEGLARVEALTAHPAIRALCGPREPGPVALPRDRMERRDWVRRNCWTYHHAVGTCAMGPASDRAAVVDATGRVHGTEGLFVADASVMPDIPSANTHIPTVMVAERLADTLR